MHIEKGEVTIVYTTNSLNERLSLLHQYFKDISSSHITYILSEKITIDMIRDFSYQFQGQIKKVAYIIANDIHIHAQHALLKLCEELDKDKIIVCFIHENTYILETLLSRSIKIKKGNSEKEKKETIEENPLFDIYKKNVHERLLIIKKILDAYEDEKITKQDIFMYIENIKKDIQRDVYKNIEILIRQPSTSLKYILEYLCCTI